AVEELRDLLGAADYLSRLLRERRVLALVGVAGGWDRAGRCLPVRDLSRALGHELQQRLCLALIGAERGRMLGHHEHVDRRIAGHPSLSANAIGISPSFFI